MEQDYKSMWEVDSWLMGLTEGVGMDMNCQGSTHQVVREVGTKDDVENCSHQMLTVKEAEGWVEKDGKMAKVKVIVGGVEGCLHMVVGREVVVVVVVGRVVVVVPVTDLIRDSLTMMVTQYFHQAANLIYHRFQ